MKAAFLAVLAALATSTIAAPAGSLSELTQVTKSISSSGSSVSSGAVAPSGAAGSASGHVVQDLGGNVKQILTVTGPDAKQLLIELSPDVTGLLSSLGLPGVGVAVGSVVQSASSLGDLLTDLAQPLEGLLTVVGQDGGVLLIQLDPSVTALVSGLGLPGVGTPVGTVVGTLGQNLKRSNGEIVQDLAPQVKNVLEVTGPNAKRLLVQLSPSVASLVANLGLPSVGTSVGSIVKTAGSIGDLLKDLSTPVEQLLTVVGQDGSYLLIQLSPEVTGLVSSLGLPGVGTSVGTIVGTVGDNL
ncbi:uncharacterized protein BO95DRAFT_33695 [Aspergillus brunneoviolaceus CBS 621.78]|uniref:Uncharacterized protein n=1 Tax=Aspergillus brunneoviolaceus CBS 621.78 TaxID=1450534 RepID=A0ACD1FSU3_9EURO|nr:hypothetical protein BO95DRAFT_33695 [Aspergillus brunneoviolaceus CBS 621.78]RAH39975.1 hypothetical protein BO95DRAFT_33695 [Aspergillus brunneoviolaceus CBS 621.78]